MKTTLTKFKQTYWVIDSFKGFGVNNIHLLTIVQVPRYLCEWSYIARYGSLFNETMVIRRNKVANKNINMIVYNKFKEFFKIKQYYSTIFYVICITQFDN